MDPSEKQSPFDARNGDLVLADGERIGATTRKDVFLSSIHGRRAKACVANGPWCSFRFEAAAAGGERLIVIPQFHDQELLFIELAWPEDRFGFEVVPWDEASCLKEKAAYEAWLTELLGSVPFQEGWGSVAAYYDSKGGSSFVRVDYSDASG
ncbi:MAG: hypothetical protein HY527_21685 [Betaproteobacteria bacterium]|nr:hypothetical protein [Betaproteobacteria bacterium]